MTASIAVASRFTVRDATAADVRALVRCLEQRMPGLRPHEPLQLTPQSTPTDARALTVRR